jgi:hypothetical protein
MAVSDRPGGEEEERHDVPIWTLGRRKEELARHVITDESAHFVGGLAGI